MWVYCPSYPFSAEPEGLSLGQDLSVGSGPSDTSNTTDTPKASSCPGSEAGTLTTHQSGQMSQPSTGSPGADLWMSSLAGFRAKMSPRPESGPESKREQEAVSGPSSPESFAKLSPDSFWLKTSGGYSQLTLAGDSEQFSETWPTSGLMQGGMCYLLPPLERHTDESESGSSGRVGSAWPTPNCADAYTANLKSSQQKPGSMHSVTLAQAVQKWPTPTARDGKGSDAPGRQGQPSLCEAVKMWPTPRANKVGGYSSPEFSPTLEQAVRMQGGPKWPTPRTAGMCGGTGNFEQMKKLEESGTITEQEHRQMTAGNGGQLNPRWVEWLMGWPIGWTALDSAATEWFRSRQRRRGA